MTLNNPFYTGPQFTMPDTQQYIIERKKAFIKIFRRYGYMMQLFNQINTFYDAANHQALRNLQQSLQTESKVCVYGRQPKYTELILYAEFLLRFDASPPMVRFSLVKNLLNHVNMTHELGRNISAKVIEISGQC